MANVTIKLDPSVLERARGVASEAKRSLSKQVELWIEQATATKPAARKRGTTLRKGERV